MSDYLDGRAAGELWAEQDLRDHEPTSFWVETLRDETRTDQRWARAFYLGALRGYRSVVRTLRDGKWGT